jgi:hypothetical protein
MTGLMERAALRFGNGGRSGVQPAAFDARGAGVAVPPAPDITGQ